VIIADIYTTAAIMRAAQDLGSDSPFRADNLVLFFDEPNMGIHLDPAVKTIASRIARFLPRVAILSSATLGTWGEAASWWRAGRAVATRVTITQEPYVMPVCELLLLDEATESLRTVNITQLTPSHGELQKVLSSNPRTRRNLLRHFSPAQAASLVAADRGIDVASWDLVGDMATARERLVEPALQNLSAAAFDEIRRTRGGVWGGNVSTTVPGGLNGVLEQSTCRGVTMVATANPHELALRLAGAASEEEWAKSKRRLRRRVREAVKAAVEARRAIVAQKDESKDEFMVGTLELRPGVQLSLAEADELDDDALVMLGSGVACAHEAAPRGVMRLFQQAVLSVPEQKLGTGGRPPIHTLVVNYSAIYGTDCPAVDTLVLMNDLGVCLSWPDLQQFIGRLRRDGRAIFTSMETMRRATLGRDSFPERVLEQARETELQKAVLRSLAAKSSAADAKAAITQVLKLHLEIGHFPPGTPAALVLRTLMQVAAGPAPVEVNTEEERGLYAAGALTARDILLRFKGLLEAWKDTLRWLTLGRESGAGETAFLSELESLCSSTNISKLLPAMSEHLLKLTYDLDIVTEATVISWATERQANLPDVAGVKAFWAKASRFVDWLSAAEEESDDED